MTSEKTTAGQSIAGPTAHETIYQKIRDKLLFGELEPGQAVTIHGLVGEFNISMTPVREAIRRLIAEGALELLGNRRVCVPPMQERAFAEIAYARLAIEPELARLATKNCKTADIDALHHIDQAVNHAIDSGDVLAYMRNNYQFHFRLYAYANSKVLANVSQSLWLRHGPLSRIIFGMQGTRNLTDLHEETLHALRAGDEKAVFQAIHGDIQQGIAFVLENMRWKII